MQNLSSYTNLLWKNGCVGFETTLNSVHCILHRYTKAGLCHFFPNTTVPSYWPGPWHKWKSPLNQKQRRCCVVHARICQYSLKRKNKLSSWAAIKILNIQYVILDRFFPGNCIDLGWPAFDFFIPGHWFKKAPKTAVLRPQGPKRRWGSLKGAVSPLSHQPPPKLGDLGERGPGRSPGRPTIYCILSALDILLHQTQSRE